MIVITQEQAQQRFPVLPESLQDAIFSDQDGEIISSVADDNHLGDERADKLLLIVGWVLLGFIHLDDLSRELQEQLSIPPQAAGAVVASLTTKIFNSLRPDLDKAYAPLPVPDDQATTFGPKILEAVQPVVPVAPKVPMPAYQPSAPSPVVIKNIPQPPVPLPSTSSGAGWSTASVPSITTGPKTVDLRNANPTPIRPMTFPNLQKTETTKIPLPPLVDSVGNRPQISDLGPVPIIIQDNTSASLSRQPDFAIKSEDKIATFNSSHMPRPDAHPAILEFGGQKPPLPPSPKTLLSPLPRTVNYSDVSPQKDRNITELTKDDIPRPPMPLS